LFKYHKLPKKSSSKSELSKRSSRSKEKTRSGAKASSPKKSKKSGREKRADQDTRLSDAEFKKLEEQVKNKFPELFVSASLFLKQNCISIQPFCIIVLKIRLKKSCS